MHICGLLSGNIHPATLFSLSQPGPDSAFAIGAVLLQEPGRMLLWDARGSRCAPVCKWGVTLRLDRCFPTQLPLLAALEPGKAKLPEPLRPVEVHLQLFGGKTVLPVPWEGKLV